VQGLINIDTKKTFPLKVVIFIDSFTIIKITTHFSNVYQARQSRKHPMKTIQRPAAARSNIANLGESTSCLLTFEDDMFQNLSEIEYDDITEVNKGKPRSLSSDRRRRVDGAGVTSNETTRQTNNKPRRVIPGFLRREDSSDNGEYALPKRTNCSRSKSRDSPKVSSPSVTSRATSTVRPRNVEVDTIALSLSPNSTENRLSMKNDDINDNLYSKPALTRATTGEICRQRPVPPGRSRPGVRTHRSGSFALRQFKENYQQTQQQRHYKKKSEARDVDTTTTEASTENSDTMCESTSNWERPPLTARRSVDGSFCIRGNTAAMTQVIDSNVEIIAVDRQQRGNIGSINTNFHRANIDVAPGCTMSLCGIDETMHALHLNRIIHAECTSCNIFLACIKVASMVLCPGCQTISPLECTNQSYDHIQLLGLGLRVEDILSNMQT
jgi:hypothetical protein